MSSPFSVRISDDLKDKLNDIKDQSGAKNQDEFFQMLLDAFSQHQQETDTDSPVQKEKTAVRGALAQAERVLTGYLEVVCQSRITTEADAKEKVEKAQVKADDLAEQNALLTTTIAELELEKADLASSVISLEEKAESLDTLKTAWSEKEAALNARLADLDAEAQEARSLKTALAEVEKIVTDKDKAISQLEKDLALCQQQSQSDLQLIDDLRSRLDVANSKLDSTQNQLADTINGKAKSDNDLATAKSRVESSQEIIDLLKQQLAAEAPKKDAGE